MVRDEDAEAIRRVAALATTHDPTATIMIETLLVRMAAHHPQAGANARALWLADLKALGETCLTLHRLLAS